MVSLFCIKLLVLALAEHILKQNKTKTKKITKKYFLMVSHNTEDKNPSSLLWSVKSDS